MSVMLRLKRMGKKKYPFYRVVAVTKSRKRDGKTLEELGHYDPKKGKEQTELKTDRIEYWLDQGAKPSKTVQDIINRHK